MVESLIENIHREDLTDVEKIRFVKRIVKEEGLKTNEEISKRIGVKRSAVSSWFDVDSMRKSLGPNAKKVSYSTIAETRGLPEEQRRILIKKAEEEDFGSRKMRELVRQVKQEPTPEPIQLERTANDTVLKSP